MGFPQVLHQILSDETNSDSIAWLPSGLTFRIHNRDKLVSDILPKYFDGKIKYTSFARKLARWKFVRVSSLDGKVAFYNKHFCRENPSFHEMNSVPSRPTSASIRGESNSPTQRVVHDSTNTSPRFGSSIEKIEPETKCGAMPLKKRPVDESKLPRKKRIPPTLVKPSRVLPGPKPIRIRPATPPPPFNLRTCSSLDIEQTGLARRKERTSTYKNDAQREALFRLLLQRQLAREGTKAKKHFDQHHGTMNRTMAKELLLQRLQEDLDRQARQAHRPLSPMHSNPWIARDLLQACKSSNISASMVLSNNECPARQPSYPTYRSVRRPSLPLHRRQNHEPASVRTNGGRRVIYDYAHAA